ncbi:unnamed protein product [Mortierella alpina]
MANADESTPQGAQPHRVSILRNPSQRQQESSKARQNIVISVLENEKQEAAEAEDDDEDLSDQGTAEEDASSGGWGEGPSHVNVLGAERDFEKLKRQLTRQSSLYRISTGEKGTDDLGVDFDLTSYLQNVMPQAQAAGMKHKNLGVAWENLEVLGEGIGSQYQGTFADPFIGIANLVNPWFWAKACFSKAPSKTITRTIIHPMNGFCRDGEMILVLGRPGAGCSTLLRVLANDRKNYKKISGDVRYGPFISDEIAKHHRGEVLYNQEVRQTLEMALKTKTPSKRLQDHRKDFVKEFLDVLTKMYGLTKQVETMVGNAFIRGISGGERKRLSIAEQMATGSSVNMWDGSTRGLDASSALDYAKSLRVQTDLLHKATMVTIYQASENIYELFDKTVLLYEGRCIFFGPADEARQYFIDMGFECPPRQTTADYLTAITDPNERRARAGFSGRLPRSPKDFEEVFKASQYYKNIEQDRIEYQKEVQENSNPEEFKDATRQMKQKHVSPGDPYTINFVGQVKALTVRQFQLTRGDITSLIARYATIIIIAVIVGSVFYRLPQSADGAFTRGGVLFMSLLFNALVSQAELPKAMEGRSILYKFAAMFATFDGASGVSGVIMLAMVLYSGYMIPYQKMHPWFIWIFWINPLAYGFKAIISLEMKGLHFDCGGPAMIPNGPTYNDINYQVCTLAGAKPGTTLVDGSDYLYTGFRYKTSEIGIDILAVICFWLLFVAITCIALEKIEFGKGGFSTNVYKKGTKLNQPIQVDEESSLADASALTVNGPPDVAPPQADSSKNNSESNLALGDMAKGSVFAWEELNYIVPFKADPSGQKQLLTNIAGLVKPGSMTALMGSSGAGKTTLLDVLAQRKNTGTVSGTIEVDGEPLRLDFQRTTGYCEQLDVHVPQCTVREALQFSARLRQPADVPEAEKDAYVQDLIHILEMEDIADAVIGTSESGLGISVEERKRLSIGVELVAKPKLLFLDEPTSGLDAQASYNLMRFMRKLTDQGQAILCTIHQPSSQLFDFFDDLLLLAKGGRTVYFGDLGHDSKELISYFERNGAPECAPNANPAEYILNVVNARRSNLNWPEIWDASQERKELLDAIKKTRKSPDEIARILNSPQGKHAADHRLEYASSNWLQFKYVFKRIARNYWRLPEYNFGRVAIVVVFALLNGFSFFQIGTSKVDLQSRVFVIFQILVMGILFLNLVEPRFHMERQWFYRELAGKYYGWKPFAFSIITIELPYVLFTGTVFFAVLYWTVGFVSDPTMAFYTWLLFIIFCLFSILLGQAVAAFTPSSAVAAILNPFIVLPLNMFCGVMMPKASMPKFWSSWMYWLDPFHYLIEGLVAAQLHDVEVRCEGDEFSVFNTPAGQTCGQYAAEFMKTATGYLNNPNATSDCQYCQYTLGQDYYQGLDISYDNIWRNVGILCIYLAFNLVMVIIGIRFLKWNRR